MYVSHLGKARNNGNQEIFIHSEKAIKNVGWNLGYIEGPLGKGNDNLFSPHWFPSLWILLELSKSSRQWEIENVNLPYCGIIKEH